MFQMTGGHTTDSACGAGRDITKAKVDVTARQMFVTCSRTRL